MKFDSTITLGNVLTALAMILGGGAVWTTASERLTRVEAVQTSAAVQDQRHDAEIRDLRNDVKSALADIKSELRDLRVDMRGVPQPRRAP